MVAACEFFAKSMYFMVVLYDFSSITALTKLLGSVTSPTVIWPTISTRADFTRDHMEAGKYAREAAEHFWPWYSKAPRTIAVTSSSTSAELCAKMKSFPPVSPTILGYER